MKTFSPTQEQIKAAELLFTAMAWEQTVRPVILKIQTEVLEKYQYKYSPEHRDLTNKPVYISDPKDAWLMGEKDFGHYITELHHRFIAANFTGLTTLGDCPLLIAENGVRKAKQYLCEVMQPITHLSWDMFFNTTKWEQHMKEYFDLTLRLLAPYCRKSENILAELTA